MDPIYGPPEPVKIPGRVGVRTVADAEADSIAARLRSQGKSYRQIARAMGCSVSIAHRRVQRALKAIPAEAVEELRTIELQRLDEMLEVARRELHRDHVLVQQGRVIRDDAGVPMIDHGAKLAALDRLVKISESRRKLVGADMPMRIEQKVTVEEVTVMDAEIRELVEKMNGADEPA